MSCKSRSPASASRSGSAPWLRRLHSVGRNWGLSLSERRSGHILRPLRGLRCCLRLQRPEQRLDQRAAVREAIHCKLPREGAQYTTSMGRIDGSAVWRQKCLDCVLECMLLHRMTSI